MILDDFWTPHQFAAFFVGPASDSLNPYSLPGPKNHPTLLHSPSLHPIRISDFNDSIVHRIFLILSSSSFAIPWCGHIIGTKANPCQHHHLSGAVVEDCLLAAPPDRLSDAESSPSGALGPTKLPCVCIDANFVTLADPVSFGFSTIEEVSSDADTMPERKSPRSVATSKPLPPGPKVVHHCRPWFPIRSRYADYLNIGSGSPAAHTDTSLGGPSRANHISPFNNELSDPPRPPQKGYEWVWHPRGYWVDREVDESVPEPTGCFGVCE